MRYGYVMPSRVERFKGGKIPVLNRETSYELRATEKRTQHVVPSLHTKVWDEWPVVPYGDGFGLISPASGQLHSGLWVDVEVRNGRPQVVAIRSGDDGPEITAQLLRFRLEEAARELIVRHTVRLIEHEGKVAGVFATAPEYAGDPRSRDERAGDVLAAREEGRRGRRPLSDDHLRDVLAEAEAARAQKRAASRAIAERWNVEPTTARQWLHKARQRFERRGGRAGEEKVDG